MPNVPGIGSGGFGGAGFTVGAPDNVFGDVSGDASANPWAVNPAADRASAETVRDAYFVSNPANLAAYDNNPALGIFIYFVDGANILTVGQTRAGGAWADSQSLTAFQGRPGSSVSLDAVDVNSIPIKSPITNEFENSGLLLDGGMIHSNVEFNTEDCLSVTNQYSLCAAGETLSIEFKARGQQLFPVAQVMDIFDRDTPEIIIQRQVRPVNVETDTSFQIDDPVFTVNIPRNMVIYSADINPAASINNLKATITLAGQTFPFYSIELGSFSPGQITIILDPPFLARENSDYVFRFYDDGQTVTFLGGATNVPYFTVLERDHVKARIVHELESVGITPSESPYLALPNQSISVALVSADVEIQMPTLNVIDGDVIEIPQITSIGPYRLRVTSANANGLFVQNPDGTSAFTDEIIISTSKIYKFIYSGSAWRLLEY